MIKRNKFCDNQLHNHEIKLELEFSRSDKMGIQMGFQNGLYAFTAAVLGGIGSIPGAVLGGVVIGLVRALSSAYVSERWTGGIVFAILIVILVFRPEGLLGKRVKEKV